MVTAKQRRVREANQKRATPRGPPKVLVRRHILEIKEDTRDWLEEQIEELKLAFIAGKGAGAVGEALGGFLSNPANTMFLLGGIGALAAGVVGKDGIESVLKYFGSLQRLLEAETPEEKTEAAHDTADTLKKLIEFFSPLGPFTPLP